MSSEFEPIFRVWENSKTQQTLEKRIKTYRRKHFDPDLQLSDIPRAAAASRWCYSETRRSVTQLVCMWPTVRKKKKNTKNTHILVKCLVSDRKKNCITLKSLPKCEGRAGAEEKARLSGVLKKRDGLGAVLYTLRGRTQHRMPINPEAQRIRRHQRSCRPERSKLLSSVLKSGFLR